MKAIKNLGKEWPIAAIVLRSQGHILNAKGKVGLP